MSPHRRTRLSCVIGLLLLSASVAANGQSPRLVLEREIAGQSVAARQLAFSPDGQLLATSTVDGTVKLWRVPDGKIVRTLRHPAGVTSVAFTGDGAAIVSGSYDGNVRVWRVADGSLARTLSGHTGTVWSIAISPDGRTIASSGEDKTVRLWRASDGAALRTLRGHTLNVWHVAFSPDGRTLGSSSFDHTIRLWSADDGRLLRTLTGHSEAIVGFAFSPDGALIASGSDDSSIKIWRVADGQLLRTIVVGNHIYSVAFSPDGQWLVGAGRARSAIGTLWHQIFGDRLSASGDGPRLWRVSDGALQDTRSATDDVVSVAISPDGQRVASAGDDGVVRLWRIAFAN